VLQPCQNQHGSYGCPYLGLNGIAGCADEVLDAQQLLEVAKEDLYVPPCLVRATMLEAVNVKLFVSNSTLKQCSSFHTACGVTVLGIWFWLAAT